MVRRADRPARTPRVGRAGGPPARHPGLRGELWLGLAQHVGSGVSGRGARDDPGDLPTRVPTRRGQLPRRGPRSGGGRTQPRRRAPADVLADHDRAGARGDPRRLSARDPRAARRVWRVRDPRLPDLHHRDLHRVQRLVQRADGLRAGARARASQPAGALRREAGARTRADQQVGSARATGRPPATAGTREARGARWLRRARRTRARSPGGRQHLLDARGRPRLSHRRVDPRRSLAHRPLQRARRAARHRHGGPGRSACRPPSGTGLRAARAQHLPGAGDARPRDRAGLLVLHRALRGRIPLSERAAARDRLRGAVLPARARRCEGVGRAGAGPRSRRSPARSASDERACCGG